MNIPVEAIENFSDEGVVNIIASTLHDQAGSIFYNPTFNPLDKVIELYERMLKEKDALLEKLLNDKR